jgi:four helix bundle protein
MGSFRELAVWQRAHALTLEIYGLTRAFPREELFGLTSQIRRAVVSVELNLAEGSGRHQNKDFVRFIGIARGSLCEVESLVLIANDLSIIGSGDGQRICTEIAHIGRMLNGLAHSVVAKA